MIRYFKRFLLSVNSITSIVTLLCTLLIYIFSNFITPLINAPSLSLYLVQPILWLSLTAFILVYIRSLNFSLFGSEQRAGASWGATFGLGQIAIVIILGLLYGFGLNPLGKTWGVRFLNTWYFTIQLIGMELSRWVLLQSHYPKNQILRIAIVWLFFSFLNLPFASYSSIQDVRGGFEFVGFRLLPELSQNLLASYLTVLGGPISSFIYLWILTAFEWLMPVLPNLPLLVYAFALTLIPVIALLWVYQVSLQKSQKASPKTNIRPKKNIVYWAVVAIFALSVIWFNGGLFGVKPMLVSGYSMEPTFIAGDIVIIQDIAPDEVKVGDVIRFNRGGSDILHRVIVIQVNGNTKEFITRGDNNNVDDAPIGGGQILGKVVMVIPKIGWISIFLRNLAKPLIGG